VWVLERRRAQSSCSVCCGWYDWRRPLNRSTLLFATLWRCQELFWRTRRWPHSVQVLIAATTTEADRHRPFAAHPTIFEDPSSLITSCMIWAAIGVIWGCSVAHSNITLHQRSSTKPVQGKIIWQWTLDGMQISLDIQQNPSSFSGNRSVTTK